MSHIDWLSEYRARLEDERIAARSDSAQALAPAHRLILAPEDWEAAAKTAADMELRWCGLSGEHQDRSLVVHACLESQGSYLVLRTEVPVKRPELPSHTPFYPGADRLERHAADLLGLCFAGHPDPRRWTRHQAWAEDRFPLRAEFPREGEAPGETPTDAGYPFERIHGDGIYEIPVGPVHAGIIEPGHFRFQVAGEPVLSLEERLGYVHKGIEKLAVGRDAAGLARLAGRISGDSTVAHAGPAARPWSGPPAAPCRRAPWCCAPCSPNASASPITSATSARSATMSASPSPRYSARPCASARSGAAWRCSVTAC